ncbi:NUDIX domain-containing protein [Microbulbifer sp. S227A]|uniref:NUDIX domain-containing protein n=1 Tax=Microbulbifer sp. S227A TaxID=3415131 RepID=UPI003C7AFD5B
MTNFLRSIRPTARAVIRREGKLLVQIKEKPGRGRYLTLPGGRQDPGETLHDCVRRECAEEIGCKVQVGRLLHVAEVFKTRADGPRHLLEHLFECTVPDGYRPIMGPHPDKSQTGTAWVNPVAGGDRFRPAYDKPLCDRAAPVYLGRLHG